jgi:DNA-directed RNA polymerase subunit RPC12/RpoP
MAKAQCDNCKKETEHHHQHSEVHAVSGTHLAGTERFKCSECGHTTFKNDLGAEKFTFILD